MYLIVGLGNPGEKYRETRHNLGFWVLDILYGGGWEEAELYRYAEWMLEGVPVVLIEPLTYMNRSGLAVGEAVERWEVRLGRLLVILDDVNLPLGRLRLRLKGSDGGHKGLASVIEALGSEEFPRLRLGIGRPADGDLITYVLSPFEEELGAVREMVGRAAEVVRRFVRDGPEAAMGWANVQVEGKI